ncbi:hypothetical protein, partial [Nocardia brasiliensis]|uniref:hypothetical protein n=1 Tax=Nocardia brasiliensis TaxID=37326 RepID=UPI002458B74D
MATGGPFPTRFASRVPKGAPCCRVVVAPPCRELLLTDAVRARAAEVAVANAADAALVEMLEKLAQGVPV